MTEPDAIDILLELAIVRAMGSATFEDRRALAETASWLRKNFDGCRMDAPAPSAVAVVSLT